MVQLKKHPTADNAIVRRSLFMRKEMWDYLFVLGLSSGRTMGNVVSDLVYNSYSDWVKKEARSLHLWNFHIHVVTLILSGAVETSTVDWSKQEYPDAIRGMFQFQWNYWHSVYCPHERFDLACKGLSVPDGIPKKEKRLIAQPLIVLQT